MLQKHHISRFLRKHFTRGKIAAHAVVITTPVIVVLIGVSLQPISKVSANGGDTYWYWPWPSNQYVHQPFDWPSQPQDPPAPPQAPPAPPQAPSAPPQAPSAPSSDSGAIAGDGNYYGGCAWWASERYHQLHDIYVPDGWGNAEGWPYNAPSYGWTVSGTPTVGAIIALQPGVQGAGSVGHVAIVEKILSNGNVWTSNVSWNGRSDATYVEFAPGDGVSFIHA